MQFVVALAVVLGPRQATSHAAPAVLDITALVIAIGAAVVSWLVTRWRIHGGELQIDSGLVRRQQLRVPLTRLQAVDVVRPLVARILGLAEIRVVVAGHGSGRARLSYLGDEYATQVRARLLALAHGLDPETPEPPEAPILAVPGGRIVAAAALGPATILAVVLLVAAALLAALLPAAAAAAAGVGLPLVLLAVFGAFSRVNAEWEFSVAEAPDGLRLRSGLLQTRAETIPYGRVQAVRWVEPLLWRPLGWVRLEVDVARQHDRDRREHEGAAATRALLPVGDAREAHWLLSRVLPGATVQPPPTATAPRRARLRALWSRQFLRAWYDAQHIVCCTGRLRPAYVVVPLQKAQSIRWQQGPWQRALRLASVEVDTAGHRFTCSGKHRDAQQAAAWVSELPDLARAARQRSR
jgi:putative membrane protein